MLPAAPKITTFFFVSLLIGLILSKNRKKKYRVFYFVH